MIGDLSMSHENANSKARWTKSSQRSRTSEDASWRNYMKRVLTVAIFVLWMGGSAFAQSLSQADRESALKYLESTRQGIINVTKDLSADQWNFEPGTGQRSIAEELEHIAAAEDLFFTVITQVVMRAPARAAGEDVKAIDQMILAKVSSDKATGRDEPAPAGRFDSPEAALNHFLESRDQTIRFLKETDNLRAHAMDSLMGKKKWDAYQWILYVAAHSEQHMKRISEVKADLNFPKM
jgi:DinB superfamily